MEFEAAGLLLLVKTKRDVEAAGKLGLEAECESKEQHGLGKFLFRSVIVITREGMKLIKLQGASNLADWCDCGGTRQEFLSLVASAQNWEPPESDGKKIIPFPSGHLGRTDDDDDEIRVRCSDERLKQEYPQWPYVIRNGRMYFGIDRRFYIELVRLCNFSAWITEEISRDDGTSNASFAFRVAGNLDDGTPLPAVTVPAAQFSSLGWIAQQWGSKPIIAAGIRDKLRAAIQEFSDATKHRVFTHTGWRQIGGSWIYLTANGGIGPHGFDGNVEVDLDGSFSNFSLPRTVEDPRAAMQASLSLLDIAPLTITATLWAAMFRAPLAAVLRPDFTVWLEGQTGKFKSTISALFLSHFGNFDAFHLPASWKSTANSLEKMAFTLKDAVMVVDDYAPTFQDANELAAKASALVRAQGNLAARGRLRSSLEQRPSFDPRGVIVSTGEQHPPAPGQSLLARMLIVDILPGAIDIKTLTSAQSRAHLLPDAMAGYLQWLAARMDAVREEAQQVFLCARKRAIKEGAHLRIPEMIAHLDFGLFFALRYAEEIRALTSAEVQKCRDECWQALIELGRRQSRLIEAQRPVERFLHVLAALIDQGRVEIAPSARVAAMMKKKNKSVVVGWHNAELIYLPPEPVFAEVVKFCRSQGEPFPVPKTRLHKELDADALLEHDPDRLMKAVKIGGQTRRLLALRCDAAERLMGMSLGDGDSNADVTEIRRTRKAGAGS